MKKMVILAVFLVLFIALLPAQQINGIVQDAVNRLASGLNTPLQVSIAPVTISGTNTPSEVSRLLYQLISASAKNNRLFQVVEPVPSLSGAPTGVIGGSFTPKANAVDVSLIASERGEQRSSVQFSIPVAELQQLGVSIEPENKVAMLERERLFSGVSFPVQQPVRIQAWFSSGSMTYLHREPLDITVMVDRDCYFKVILVDTNNHEQVIFPNEDDEDNYLKANLPREVFKGYSYMLYDPYGSETILVVASTSQFNNIKQDYLSPSRLATAASVRNSILNNSVARYDITKLKPHGEYSMELPSDIDIVQTIKTDVDRQYGKFSGTARSGYYTIRNERASYRVTPIDNQYIIDYAFYYQDAWSGSLNRATRGTSGFSFFFDKPADMNKAYINFKSSIKKKFGKESGDINSGNFSALGLEGKYSVSDKVYVTIISSPGFISDDFIEKEAKGFFNSK
jgi:hypothetical protein